MTRNSESFRKVMYAVIEFAYVIFGIVSVLCIFGFLVVITLL